MASTDWLPIDVKTPLHRVLDADTVQPDITAYELVRLMVLNVTYDQASLESMTPEDRALVERNTRLL